MTEPDNLNGAAADPFRARYGVPAGTQAPAVELRQWEQLCRELLQEREQLRAQLAAMKADRDAALDLYSAKVVEGFTLSREDVLRLLETGPALDQVIADLGRDQQGAPAGTGGPGPSDLSRGT